MMFFVLNDGSDCILTDHQGKELASFDNWSLASTGYAEYIDVSGLVNGVVDYIAGYEQPKTAAETAKENELDIEEYKYNYHLEGTTDFKGQVSAEFKLWYPERMAEEKTHVVTEDDGWFTQSRTVSDGYAWKDILPTSAYIAITNTPKGISMEDFYKRICTKLREERTEEGDGIYNRSVTVGGRQIQVRTETGYYRDKIEVHINFPRQ